MNDRCARSTLAKYTSRPGPPYPANDPDCHGRYRRGNDGLWYKSVPNKNGVFAWKKSPPPPAAVKRSPNRARSPPVKRSPNRARSPPVKRSPNRARSPPRRRRSPSVINLTANNNINVKPTIHRRPNAANANSMNATSWVPMLAQVLKGPVPPGSAWLVSEKLDGVRALWDGKGGLWTRGKNPIAAPAWFTASLPRGLPLDGELFAGRGQFNRVNSAWRSGDPSAWAGIQFRVFDAPASRTAFSSTYERLQTRLNMCRSETANGSTTVCLVRQQAVSATGANANVDARMKTMLAGGGEGLVLRRADSRYTPGRSAAMLKITGIQDAEALVTGYDQGTGRLEGVMGALRCVWTVDGRQVNFKVGTGFSDDERANYAARFPIGSQITVEFMELTAAGKPRHPRIKGVRSNL